MEAPTDYEAQVEEDEIITELDQNMHRRIRHFVHFILALFPPCPP
jgi:hypothetical protein